MAVLLLFLISANCAQGQKIVVSVVYDAVTKKPIPFATVRYSGTNRGTIADLDGVIAADVSDLASVQELEVYNLGYETQKLAYPLRTPAIYLTPSAKGLAEVVIKPDYEKVYRILGLAIRNKSDNNPEQYPWYRCRIYYKMLVDLFPPDSVRNDTTRKSRELLEMMDRQHLLMSETYSRRTWKQPQKLQEDVVGSRISGFSKSMFTGFVTDILPFHSYNDYVSLNGKDYFTPLASGYRQRYKYYIADEIIQGRDTLWVINFSPKGHNGNELKGKLCINSHGYAIANLVATASDTILNREISLEQQYELVKSGGKEKWFPSQLNYKLVFRIKTKKGMAPYTLVGRSIIDSVSLTEDPDFRFDKQHTVKLEENADQLSDSIWKGLRPAPLDSKEERTYVVLDSVGRKEHFDRFMSYLSRLPEGKIPLGLFDVDLKRLISTNYYERYRFGLGLQTNEQVSRWFSVGGWGGYGIEDAQWKYGGFAELFPTGSKEFTIRAGYEHDISDPGRVHLDPDLDKNYLKSYLLRRVDLIDEYAVSVKRKLGYLTTEVSAKQQDIHPRYPYALESEGRAYTSFAAQEVSLKLRYAYAERTAPIFGHYVNVGCKYPIAYGIVTRGILKSSTMEVPYTRAVAAVAWQKHINRIGKERFLLEGGKVWSGSVLPLSKLFAGNGFKNSQQSIYTFGGIMTMAPYDYYMDQFVSLVFRHDCDWKIFRLGIEGSGISSAPFLSLQYNALYGTLSHPEAQRQVTFLVPDNVYHEGGLMLNSILRHNYMNVYYFTLNAGYFYHFTPTLDLGKNGRFVYGLGVEF